MTPVCSAAEMKSFAGRIPRVGWFQRINASTPVIVRSASSHMGQVVQLELPSFETVLQFYGELELLNGPGVHRGLEQLIPVPPVRFRGVHRCIRVPDEVVGGGGARSLAERDADTGPDRHLATQARDRLPQDLEDALGHADGPLFGHVLLEQHDELVAVQPRHRVARAARRQDALRDCHQHLVTGMVSQAVVDDLEPVEVEQQDGDLLGAAGDPGERAP